MSDSRTVVLSIDIGSTGLKLGMYDAAGSCLHFLRKDTPARKLQLETIDVSELYDGVIAAIREAVDHSGLGRRVEVIGIDGQMGGIVGIGDRWAAVIPFDPPINNNFKPHLDQALARFGTQIVEETGSIPINGAKILYWMKEQPAVFRKVRKVLTLAGYVVGRLIGLEPEDAHIDRTSLYLFGLAREGGWSDRICNLLGIPLDVLPRIRESSHIVGELGRQAAAACGLRDGIPVIAGMGDTAASILGAGVIDYGQGVDIAGTCSVLGFCTARPAADPGNLALLRLQAPLPDTWYMVGIGFGGEICRWFLEKVFLCKGPDRGHDELIRAAEEIPPGSEELLFLPFLGGTFTPPNDRVRGMWCGLDWKHSVYHMYRSVLESIAYEYAYYQGIYHEISPGRSCRSITVTGSGKKNGLWNQIKADVLGCEFRSLKREDHENLGTALVAARALDLIPDIRASLNRCLEVDRRYAPGHGSGAAYQGMFQRYLRCRRQAMSEGDYPVRREGAGKGP